MYSYYPKVKIRICIKRIHIEGNSMIETVLPLHKHFAAITAKPSLQGSARPLSTALYIVERVNRKLIN